MEQLISDKFIQLLRMEAQAIEHSATLINRSAIEQAVQILLKCTGKVVLIGIGKSGDVSRKIVSTMNSTGTPAMFLHPTDALHGDLGVVRNDDVVIALSNSGETDELLLLIPHLKTRNVPIIAIVGKPSSTLARSSEVVLEATVEKEACPLNLAPTTSTTVALAIGDALAMVLMEARGWTPTDFALNHPAGRLGKRLTLKVESLMHKGADNPKISADASWIEVISAMSKGGLGAVNVVAANGQLLGLITDGDLRRAFQNRRMSELEIVTADNIMTKKPITIEAQSLAYEALELMQSRNRPISHLSVVDSKTICVGIIRLHDLVRVGLT
jgi:arabinose-5-phosphate isomerase